MNLLWIEDALANIYKDNCCIQNIIVTKDYGLDFRLKKCKLTHYSQKISLNEILKNVWKANIMG